VARIRAQTVYMLACGQCADGKDVIVFGSVASRIDWMRDHAGATGHDGYLVQDIERLVAEDHCPICDRSLGPDPEPSRERDGPGDQRPVRWCPEHGGWDQGENGNLVPLDRSRP
jgi:hypothetical protein